MRSLGNRRTLTKFTGIAVIQVMFDFADVKVLPSVAVALLFANCSHEPIALAGGLSDTRGYAVAACPFIIRRRIQTRTMRRGRRGSPTLLVVAIIILELLALPLPRIGGVKT